MDSTAKGRTLGPNFKRKEYCAYAFFAAAVALTAIDIACKYKQEKTGATHPAITRPAPANAPRPVPANETFISPALPQ